MSEPVDYNNPQLVAEQMVHNLFMRLAEVDPVRAARARSAWGDGVMALPEAVDNGWAATKVCPGPGVNTLMQANQIGRRPL